MKHNHQAKRISRFIDGDLNPSARARLAQDLAQSPDLDQLQMDYTKIGELLREQEIPTGQTSEAAWTDIRRSIRVDPSSSEASSVILSSRLKWVAAMISILFVVLGIGTVRNLTPVAIQQPTEVEWVETEVPGAMTMVYQDDETGLTVIWMMEEDDRDTRHVES